VPGSPDPCYTHHVRDEVAGGRRPRLLLGAAVTGGGWGFLAYALLWGHTPVIITRSFVVSSFGTLLLLPVRIVLWGIRSVEGWTGRPFEFSERNGWIGVLAGAVGAAIGVLVVAGTTAALRRARRRSR
jgi:hypothetical protein